MEITYDWCSKICENCQRLRDWKGLLLDSLEIGFRHLDFQGAYFRTVLTHTERHLEMADAVFESQKSEAIADLLHAWTTSSITPAYTLLDTCAERLVCLHNLVPFSSRLRRLVIRSVELIGYKGFEGVGVERFTELLNHLCVTTKDMDTWPGWGRLLLGILQTPEGAQNLSHWYWELLVELAILFPPSLKGGSTYSPWLTAFLAEAQEWEKLECWMGIVWIVWPPEASGMTEEDLDRLTLLLFCYRPGAFQKLEKWVERWSQESGKDAPESFRRICKKAQEVAQWDTL